MRPWIYSKVLLILVILCFIHTYNHNSSLLAKLQLLIPANCQHWFTVITLIMKIMTTNIVFFGITCNNESFMIRPWCMVIVTHPRVFPHIDDFFYVVFIYFFLFIYLFLHILFQVDWNHMIRIIWSIMNFVELYCGK